MRYIFTAVLPFAAMVFVNGCLTVGCAEMKAVDVIGDTAKTVAVALVEKATFNSSQAKVEGQIRDPEYTADMFWVTGVHMNVRVRGVTLDAGISGIGTGSDKPLTPETIAALREKGLSDDVIRKIGEAVARAIDAQLGNPPAPPPVTP